MKYLAVLGRQPLLSVAELESLFFDVKIVGRELAEFSAETPPEIARLGGTLKIAERIAGPVVDFLANLPADGKITLGVSDFSRGATAFKAQGEALRLKRFLVKQGRSVRVVANKAAALSSATSLHNGLTSERKVEIIKNGKDYYRVIEVQDIEAYAARDQKRPARDAKVGMLPPKLAQILVNLCGNLPTAARVLDPFCGTGVVLQEAMLMGYRVYGTDVSEKMVAYTEKNLEWLGRGQDFVVQQGDATSFQWEGEVDAVACEAYLGAPMSAAPAEIKLKAEMQNCRAIILGFLRNLSGQIAAGTPVVVAVPAWLRADGRYERLNLLDEIQDLRYNVVKFTNLEQRDLLYHRDGQVVAREIIILRKQ